MSDADDVHVEVELKFPVDDVDRVRAAVRELGASPQAAIEQVDTYFAHPQRDFAATDEALRIRRTGEAGYLTYKGPLLDQDTKSREETEIALVGGEPDARRLAAVLERLGFRSVRDVRKTRQPWTLTYRNFDVEIAFDDVAGLGTFVEIETSSTPAGFAAARQTIQDLAAQLDLIGPQRRSYLALLLEREVT